MESRIKSSMENLSDIQRDTWSGSAGLLVRSMWSQMREDRARQKATWANLPSLWTTDGMRESGGGTKCEKEGKKIKRKNELMIIEGPCDSKTFMVFAICLNKTKNESVKTPQNKTGDVRDDCDGNAVGWNERLCTWARKSLWGSPGLQHNNTDWYLHNYKSLLSSIFAFLLCINTGRDGTVIQTLTSSVASCFSLQDHQGCPHPSHPSESSLPRECQLEHNIELRDLT